jgi:hypothetical protein
MSIYISDQEATEIIWIGPKEADKNAEPERN